MSPTWYWKDPDNDSPPSIQLVERFCRTLHQHLSKIFDENQTDRDQHIPLFLMTYRSPLNNATDMTPAKLAFGREISLPEELMFASPETWFKEPQNYSLQLENHLRKINRLIRERLKIASDKIKTRYDIRANSVSFE